jgi:hypothetical protein
VDQAPFGDAMSEINGSVFRIALLNPGGFPVNRKSTKSKIIEEQVRPIQASVCASRKQT